jgi:hypothetical protein
VCSSDLHRSGEELAMALPGHDEANLFISGAGRSLAMIDLADSESSQRIDAPGLRAAAQLWMDSPAQTGYQAIVDNRQVLLRLKEGSRNAKLYANILPTERGGSIRVIFEDGSGVGPQASALAGMGFLVSVRGNSLIASLDADSVAADAAGIEEALVRAGQVLRQSPLPQPGRESEDLAALAADLKARPAEAAACAAVVQASVTPSWTVIGRVDGRSALRGRVMIEDGRYVDVLALRDSDARLLSHARLKLSDQVLSAAQARALLQP